jgi:hypothetical protein
MSLVRLCQLVFDQGRRSGAAILAKDISTKLTEVLLLGLTLRTVMKKFGSFPDSIRPVVMEKYLQLPTSTTLGRLGVHHEWRSEFNRAHQFRRYVTVPKLLCASGNESSP